MIVVGWKQGEAVVLDGGELVVRPESERAFVEKLLKRSATVQRSVEIPDDEGGPGIEERMVEIEPGDPGHTRAALLSLPESVLIVDSEPE